MPFENALPGRKRRGIGPLFYGTCTPLRRYERLGRLGGRGPKGYARAVPGFEGEGERRAP
jgi:hypothetical protein